MTNMAEDASGSTVRVGALVDVKGVPGVVRYVGPTLFASGKWVGVELSRAEGKNNGTVQGKRYFTCADNCGVFVRQSQITLASTPATPATGSADVVTGAIEATAAASVTPTTTAATAAEATTKMAISPSATSQQLYSARDDGDDRGTVEPSDASASPLPSSGADARADTEDEDDDAAPAQGVTSTGADTLGVERIGDDQEVQVLRRRLATVEARREQDRVRIKELERYRALYEQMVEYKTRWTASQAALHEQLDQAKRMAAEATEAKSRAESELADLTDRTEGLTLDKEIAEERLEAVQSELETLKARYEELQRQARNEPAEGRVTTVAAGDGATATGAECASLTVQNERLKEALIKMRDMLGSTTRQTEQQARELESERSALHASAQRVALLSTQLVEAERQVAELKESVDAAAGVQAIVERLTDRVRHGSLRRPVCFARTASLIGAVFPRRILTWRRNWQWQTRPWLTLKCCAISTDSWRSRIWRRNASYSVRWMRSKRRGLSCSGKISCSWRRSAKMPSRSCSIANWCTRCSQTCRTCASS